MSGVTEEHTLPRSTTLMERKSQQDERGISSSTLREGIGRPSHNDNTDRHNMDFDSLSTGPVGVGDAEEEDEDISILHENIMKQSRTIEDFTRIIADWRNDREQRQKGDGASMRTSYYGGGEPSTSAMGVRGLQVKGSSRSLRRDAENNRLSLDVDNASQYSYEASSVGDPDEMMASPSASPVAGLSPLALQADAVSKNVKVRCTCCCGRGTRRCKRARRATREWSEVESDLRLAAEIGQALLRRNDALQSELSQGQLEYSSRVDSLMKKLTSSIREASQLERNREQSELNLEAAEASNRSLVRELDETRRELTKLRGVGVRNTGLEGKLERSLREVGDIKQELAEERKKNKRLEKIHAEMSEEVRIARIESKKQVYSEEDRARRREEMKSVAEARVAAVSTVSLLEDNKLAEGLVVEVEMLQQENAQLKEMLEARGEELVQMREDWSHRNDIASSLAVDEDKDEHLQLSDLPPRTFGALSSEIVEEDMKPAGSYSHRSASMSPSRSVLSGSERQSSTLLSPAITSDAPFSPSLSVGSAATAETTIIDNEGVATRQDRASTLLAAPSTSLKATKDTRTAQLMTLLEMVQRIFSRLSSADVDTLSKRLQRQKLTGDVGHLARTTVNGILRDVEGLREHFRKGIEMEARGRDADTASMGSRNSGKSEKESESLVAPKEFFSLIKVFRELFVEIAKLRNAVNEVTLQPQNAARILQEQLGLGSNEDKGMGAWIGRLFAATPIPGVSSLTAASNSSSITSGQTTSQSSNARPVAGRVTSGPQLVSRASVSTVPSTVAIEVKGAHASEQSSSSSPHTEAPLQSRAQAIQSQQRRNLSRAQSRNLSGLFVGSFSSGNDDSGSKEFNYMGQNYTRLTSEQSNTRHNRLSRIVDDDEISIHQGFTPKRGLRPRNLSDSSIRTTYMDDEDKLGSRLGSTGKAPVHISRIITPSTLSLQASSMMHAGVVHSYTSSSSAISEDSASTISSPLPPKEAPTSFLSSLAPRATVSKALSFLAAPTSAPPHPTLRSTSSSAKLSLAALEGNTAKPSPQQPQQQPRAVSEDLFRVGQSRARDMGF